jgi:signal transduction histidine kinase
MTLKLGLDRLAVGVILCDLQRNITYVNNSAVKILSDADINNDIRRALPDFNVDKLIGKNIDLFHVNPAHQITILDNLTHAVEYKINLGGHLLSIKTTALLNNEEQRLGYIAEVEDITVREQTKAGLIEEIERNKNLNQQVLQMQKMESLSRLTSGIAHDFNNILSAIIGYNQLNKFAGEDCTDESLKEEIIFNTEQVSKASERAVNLIKKMMAYSRQSTTNTEIEVKPTHEVIDEVLVLVRPALTSKFQLNAEIDSELTIQIDSTSLHQILTNLIVNARDAMKQGGSITVALKQVKAHGLVCNSCVLKHEGEFIELSVADNGTGSDKEIVTHIFDPFFTTKKVGEGTGLGLSAVSGMVHEAEGHIIVESITEVLNTGTTFRLLFPIVIAA